MKTVQKVAIEGQASQPSKKKKKRLLKDMMCRLARVCKAIYGLDIFASVNHAYQGRCRVVYRLFVLCVCDKSRKMQQGHSTLHKAHSTALPCLNVGILILLLYQMQ